LKVAFGRKLSDELYTLAQFLLLKSTFTNRMSYIPEIFLLHTVTCYLCHVNVVMLLADMVQCHLNTEYIEYSPPPSCGSEMSFFCYVVFFLICIYHDAVYWTSWL